MLFLIFFIITTIGLAAFCTYLIRDRNDRIKTFNALYKTATMREVRLLDEIDEKNEAYAKLDNAYEEMMDMLLAAKAKTKERERIIGNLHEVINEREATIENMTRSIESLHEKLCEYEDIPGFQEKVETLEARLKELGIKELAMTAELERITERIIDVKKIEDFANGGNE